MPHYGTLLPVEQSVSMQGAVAIQYFGGKRIAPVVAVGSPAAPLKGLVEVLIWKRQKFIFFIRGDIAIASRGNRADGDGQNEHSRESRNFSIHDLPLIMVPWPKLFKPCVEDKF
jgi:hypothetical protein